MASLRQRGRPKVVLARTYEEAWDIYQRYKDNCLGVISDVRFPINNVEDKGSSATEGNIQAALVAALHDRIDVREGRPQKYGTQRNGNRLCPLLNEKMVNQWRKEVGLPPLDEYSK